MAARQGLEIRQGHRLGITIKMQQSLRLLQYSRVDLDSFIQDELERNPFLADDNDEGADALPEEIHGGASPVDMFLPPAENEAARHSDWSRPPAGSRAAPGELEFAANLPQAAALRDHLRNQLPLLCLAGADVGIAHVLIDSVDDGGYLRDDLAEVAVRLGCDLSRIEALLRRLQALEPTGVFARDLRECLSLQLAERNRLDPAMQSLLANLQPLARRDMPALRRVCGVDDDDLLEMVAEIRALTPKPGAAYGCGPIAALVPDLIVRSAAEGEWLIEMNGETLPKLLVDRRYQAKVRASPLRPAEKSFVVDRLAEAEWLVRSLDQRARTILKVAAEIVRHQSAFLSHGIEHLRPLTLKAVADAAKVHPSTVSRAISGKYVATPRGVFELKFFFAIAIPVTDGCDARSAAAIRHRIRMMIDGELADPGAVLSDDRIVELLRSSGVDIARRTVTKYREAMHIPSSFERKRLARAGV